MSLKFLFLSIIFYCLGSFCFVLFSIRNHVIYYFYSYENVINIKYFNDNMNFKHVNSSAIRSNGWGEIMLQSRSNDTISFVQNTEQFNVKPYSTRLPSLLNVTTISNIGNRCHKYSNLVAMAKTNNPPLHIYSTVSLLMEPSIEVSEEKPVFMIVGILSSSENRDMRDAVRETWGSRSLLSTLKRTVKMVFILGVSKNQNDRNYVKILEEQKVHNDLLQLNVQDSRKHLVLKSLGFFDWADSRGNFSFVAKADVDSFLNISSILQGLHSIGNPDELSNIPTIYGSLVKGVYSRGWGHWKMPATFCCKKDIFPDYHSGGDGYILTRAALKRLVPLFKCLPHFEPEDTWITGFLCDYRNVSRLWLPGSYIYFKEPDYVLARTLDYNRPILENLLFTFTNLPIFENLLSAFTNHTNNTINLETIKFISQKFKKNSPQLIVSAEWFRKQITSRALYVNNAHLKLSPRELHCLWKKGITSEQLYIDFLLYSTKKAPASFYKLLQDHAERILHSYPVLKNERKMRARFRCSN